MYSLIIIFYIFTPNYFLVLIIIIIKRLLSSAPSLNPITFLKLLNLAIRKLRHYLLTIPSPLKTRRTFPPTIFKIIILFQQTLLPPSIFHTIIHEIIILLTSTITTIPFLPYLLYTISRTNALNLVQILLINVLFLLFLTTTPILL